MKKISLLLIGLLFLIGLSGCVEEEMPPVVEPTEEEVVVTEEPEEVTAYRLPFLTQEICDAITETEKKNECYEFLKDSKYFDSALKNLDTKECEKIKSPDVKGECKSAVGKGLEEQEAGEESAKKLKEQQDKMNEILANQKLEDCETLEYEFLVNDCKTNIYLELAVSQKDPSICENIESEILRETCRVNSSS